ncbi:MAG: bifunctional phosphopantothenoylcysteine decarboxylase/phosphopantothenate synthase, partial [Alphaproteobacteria bacterium]|nr:bifunctional phosphopantothenoylcysteine decarboxylase/phosphopantothenate synthase [Alphaproteobacteria bacterium]
VADWRPDEAFGVKLKKGREGPPSITLVENPDILATLSAQGPSRPRVVVGFAAETNDVEAHARAKLSRKGCDWIVANDVTEPGVMGGLENAVMIISREGVERWARAAKDDVAMKLALRLASDLSEEPA